LAGKEADHVRATWLQAETVADKLAGAEGPPVDPPMGVMEARIRVRNIFSIVPRTNAEELLNNIILGAH
jgi:hypothetical protein